MASCRSDGYGQINRGVQGLGMTSSHRVSWRIHFGEIPDGLHVLHHCDNKLCVNPAHLFLGTNDDNIRDKVSKKRTPTGENHHNHKLTADDVLKIREMYKPWNRESSLSVIAKLFNVDVKTIHKIILRKTWIEV